MISEARSRELKQLFQDDGVELSDDELFDAGRWLLERARSICCRIPNSKSKEFAKITEEIQVFRTLYKPKEVRDTRANS